MNELDEHASRGAARQICQQTLAKKTADERVAWALDTLPGQHILSSSFGAQSAVMLHLLTQQWADIPVVLIDTGYLFPETYRFVDELTDRLALNLKIYRAETSSAWQETRYGRRWEKGPAALRAYNEENKVLPMERALSELDVGTWFAGLRRSQSKGRQQTPFVSSSGERWKVHPIADWSDRDVHRYLQTHKLPYHPLWEKGYVSIGDVHTTRTLAEAGSAEATRFFGLQRECGLHEMDYGETG
ncbi:MAG: phosphoadenylyl-sulfate reductase [Gammaproteobacteria bacterium]|nr:phosphoadenylyl-sulfate reductase [Gammaproteobacteria bacterium]